MVSVDVKSADHNIHIVTFVLFFFLHESKIGKHAYQ